MTRTSLNFARPARFIAVAIALALAAGCGKGSADEHMKKADAYVAANQLDEAVIEYRLALEIDVKRGDIHKKLADTYEAKRDYGNAFREYINAADLLPDDITLQLKAGNYLLLAAQFTDAQTRASKVLDKDPKNVDALIMLGNAHAGLKDFASALSDYQEAIALNPSEDRAYSNSGMLEFIQGKKDEAEASLRKAVEVAPKSLDARLSLAGFLWSAQRYSDAESVLKAALELDPNNVQANRALGTFYVASNRLPEAEPYFQAVAKNAKTADDTIGLADYYAMARRNDDAKKVLKPLADDPKTFAVATTRLAAIDVTEGNRALAHEKLRQVIDKYPQDMSARLLEARVLLLDGKREDALKQAKSIVAEEPNAPEAAATYMLIGGINATLDRFEDATQAYSEVLKRQRRPLGAELALAALSMKTGQFDKARTYIQQAQTEQPDNPMARALSVRLLLAQQKKTEARDELAKLQKQFPNAPEVLKLTAAQQLNDKQYDAARASYTKALQGSPGDIEAATGLITTDLASGKKADALARLETGLKSATPSSGLYILAARTYAATGDRAKAEEYLVKATEIDPARIEAYALLGQLYAVEGRLPAAIDQYQKVVERNPNSVPANTLLAMLLEGQQRLPEAEKQYEKVIQLNPNAPVAANNLAWMYVSTNRNLDQALQLAQSAVRALPDEPHVTDTLGWVYYRRNMASQAIPYLESSVEKQDLPMTRYHLGMAYYAAGDLEKAKKQLTLAVANNAKYDGVDEARKTLAALGGSE